MNEPARLTAASRARLLRQADESDARASAAEAGARELRDGSGGGELKAAERLEREAARLRYKARRFRTRAGRGTDAVAVSDHALVRYAERRYGLDLDALRAEILPDGVAGLARQLGDGAYPVDGPLGPHTVTVRGGCVVTVTL